MKRFSLFPLLATVGVVLISNSESLATVLKASSRLAGFSSDSSHYIYLESYRNPITTVPTAKMQIIKVANNSCVSNGCLATDYNTSASDLTNKEAEDDLLTRTVRIRQRLGLNQLKLGLKLPVINRSVEADGTEIVQVLVSTEKEPLEIRLEQDYIPSILSGGTSNVDRASLRLITNYDYRKLTVGNLKDYRETVRKYSIREVRLSPDRQNIVVLLDMYKATYNASWQTTLVQSFPIND
ncbi:MAG: DUF2259 domain-containing protein [Coleofasciculaceae cyanobacterium]